MDAQTEAADTDTEAPPPAPEEAEAAPADAPVDPEAELEGINLFKPDAPETPAAPAEEVKAEPTAEPEQPAETPKSKSSDFVAMARLEKQLREERTKREALEKKVAETAPLKLTEESFWQEAAKQGIDPQRLINRLVEMKEPPKPKSDAELRAEALEKQVEDLRKRTLEREESEKRARAEAAAVQGKANIRAEISKAADKFHFLSARADDVVEQVWAAMMEQYQADGTILNLEEKLPQLEAYYEAQAEELASVLTKKRGAPTLPSSSQQQTTSRPPASGPKTLTNRAAASSAPSPRKTPLTDEEREAEAAAALKWR